MIRAPRRTMPASQGKDRLFRMRGTSRGTARLGRLSLSWLMLVGLAACHAAPPPPSSSASTVPGSAPYAMPNVPVTVEVANVAPEEGVMPISLQPAAPPLAASATSPIQPEPRPPAITPTVAAQPVVTAQPVAAPVLSTAGDWPPPPPPPVVSAPAPAAAGPVYRVDGVTYPSMVEAKAAMDRNAALALASVPMATTSLPSMLVVIPTPGKMSASYDNLPKDGQGPLTRTWLNLINQRQAELGAQAVRRSGLFTHVTILTSDDVAPGAFYGHHYKMILGFFPEPGWLVSDIHGVRWFVPSPPTGSLRAEHLKVLLGALQTAVTAMGPQ